MTSSSQMPNLTITKMNDTIGSVALLTSLSKITSNDDHKLVPKLIYLSDSLQVIGLDHQEV